MSGCLPSTLFLSELLVLITSCVFVVMALLTAVVSVTNITFSSSENDDLSNELYCNLPHRFSIDSSFDLPSITFSSNLSTNSAVICFHFLVISTLRNYFIQTEQHSPTSLFNVSSDNIIELVRKTLTAHQTQYSISTIPPYDLFNIFSEFSEIAYKPISNNNNSFSFKFSLSKPTLLSDIEAIKTTLAYNSKPIILTIPFNLLCFFDESKNGLNYQKRFNSCFLSNSTYSYILYGWNDDFVFRDLFKSPLNSDNFFTGGFIVRQLLSEDKGHTISYYYGNMSTNEEKHVCPFNYKSQQFYNPNQTYANIVPYSCIDKHRCNSLSEYYLLKMDYNNESIQVVFLEMFNNKTSRTVEFNFTSKDDMNHYFRHPTSYDHCNFFFLPYTIFKDSFSRAKTIEQLSYAIFSKFDWAGGNDTSLNDYTYRFSSRPQPLFDL